MNEEKVMKWLGYLGTMVLAGVMALIQMKQSEKQIHDEAEAIATELVKCLVEAEGE